jgi:hypothetical protein
MEAKEKDKHVNYIVNQIPVFKKVIEETTKILKFLRCKEGKGKAKIMGLMEALMQNWGGDPAKKQEAKQALFLLKLYAELLGIPINNLGEPEGVDLFEKNDDPKIFEIQKKFVKALCEILNEKLGVVENNSERIDTLEKLVFCLNKLLFHFEKLQKDNDRLGRKSTKQIHSSRSEISDSLSDSKSSLLLPSPQPPLLVAWDQNKNIQGELREGALSDSSVTVAIRNKH